MTTPAELPRMIEAARAARENAHAPYSKFKVGAAILGESGRIFAGCNVENAAYPQGQCAESSAIGAMVTAGDRRIRAIVVMGGEAGAEEICTPCGGCRQRIREFADQDVVVVSHGVDGTPLEQTIAELLPHSFGPEFLGR